MATTLRKSCAFEWPTLSLLALVYLLWILLILNAGALGEVLTVLFLIPVLTLHSSLQHEIIHIVEPRARLAAQVLTFPAIGLFIPYIRFRDAHLAHHNNELLTDPLDDPESCYLTPETWKTLSRPMQKILTFNNTLLGRVTVGPLIGQIAFMAGDWKAVRAGDRAVLRGWLAHIPAVILVLAALFLFSELSLLTYLIAAYCALSVLKIRTYLEHRAEETANGRSVIIEDRGPLAFLFLNNNMHAVHHAHPSVPWYNLPSLYFQNKAKFTGQNKGYVYKSYAQIFKLYFLRAKEPVSHPIWSLSNRNVR